jgi:DNA-binding transcriptional LysR family regulator
LRPQRDMQIIWTAELPLGCVVAKDHPLADRLQVTLQDVVGWPLAAQSRVLAIRRYLDNKHSWLLEQAKPPLATNSLQLVKSLVRSGSHVAITSELDVGPELLTGDVHFIPLKDRNASPQTISVALCANRSLPRIAKIVAEILSLEVAAYLQKIRQRNEPSTNPPMDQKSSE